MTRPTRLRRSELSTPGSNPKMIERAAASNADLVFLDLEDAVSPNEKVPSRKYIVEGLNTLDWGKKTRAVRINGTHTHWCYEDLVEVVTGAGRNIDVIILPKPKSPRHEKFRSGYARCQRPCASSNAHKQRGTIRIRGGDQGTRLA